ncbi:MAG: HAD hydrolase-like protein [Candidatus Lokiarchaeota archaeon]|nr:HAD hydrolase-like protein [Candidatus Lokiarchaeota archaeon]
MKNQNILEFDYYLFDLDNSLLDIPTSSEYFDTILFKTLEWFEIEKIPIRKERDNFWGLGVEYIDLLKVWGVYLENYGKFWKVFDSIDFKNRKILINQKKIRLYSDVIEVLEKLAKLNKKLAIVSNTAKYIVDYIVSIFGIDKYVHYAFGLGYEKEQEIAKPSPEGIKFTLKKLKFNSELSKAIMIGDSKVDIYAAKRANIYACLIKRELERYNNGYNKWKYKPDYIIDNLNVFFF